MKINQFFKISLSFSVLNYCTGFFYFVTLWPFTVWINCSSDLTNLENYQPSAWNFKSFSQSLEQFFLTVGQNNFGNKKYHCFDLFVEMIFAFTFTTISNDSIAKHTCFYSWSILLYTHKEETITFQYNSKYIVEKCGNIKEICMFKIGEKMWNHLGDLVNLWIYYKKWHDCLNKTPGLDWWDNITDF